VIACAGGLFNIIRGVPFTAVDSKSASIQWYVPGAGRQLGAEGFLMGISYVAFALCCYSFTRLPQWFAESTQTGFYRLLCYALLLASVALFRLVVGFYTFKTNYQLRYYFMDWLRGIRL
jgi:hypothetical protein